MNIPWQVLGGRPDEIHCCINLRRTLEVDPDRKSTRLNSSHSQISYAVFCLKKKNTREKEHTSEVQSQSNIVWRLFLAKNTSCYLSNSPNDQTRTTHRKPTVPISCHKSQYVEVHS